MAKLNKYLYFEQIASTQHLALYSYTNQLAENDMLNAIFHNKQNRIKRQIRNNLLDQY